MKIHFSTIISFAFISVIVLTVGCKQEVIYPIIPAIKYKATVIQKSVLGKDSALKLTISYTDGDGDLGLRQEDIAPPFDAGTFYYNMYVYYYELIEGKWCEVTVSEFIKDTIRIKYRFPYLTPNSGNKAIKGDIENTFSLPSRDSLTTIKLKFYIYDRMLHKSNVDSSDIITYSNPY